MVDVLLAIFEQLQLVGRADALPLDLVHVLLHQNNLANQISEVLGHSLEELVQRDFDLLHFLFEAADALLELLAQSLVVLLALGCLGDELLRGNIRHGLLLDVDVVVAGAFVHDLNVRMLVLHDLILDRRVVTVLGVVLDLPVDLRVLRENLTQQELLTQRERLNLGVRNVHELSLDVVAEVIIAEE